MKIGFIGFGGAAYGLAKGLGQEGLAGVYYFDALWETLPNSEVILRHAAETGALFKQSIEALVEEVDIVISCVTGFWAVISPSGTKPEPLHPNVGPTTSWW